jgi:hypothetical protein
MHKLALKGNLLVVIQRSRHVCVLMSYGVLSFLEAKIGEETCSRSVRNDGAEGGGYSLRCENEDGKWVNRFGVGRGM